MLYCHNTSRVPGEPNGNLFREKGGRGFPFIAFLDAKGLVLATHKTSRTVEEFEKTAKEARSVLTLRREAAAGDEQAKAKLFLIQLKYGQIELAKAREMMKGLRLSKEEVVRAEAAIVNLEVTVALSKSRHDRSKAGAEFWQMYRKGRIPNGRREYPAFFRTILAYAEKTENLEAFETALKKLRERYGNKRGAKKWLDRWERTLERLRKKNSF